MAVHDIIVIGASAGGVEALTRLVSDLPAYLPAAVFVVMHLPVNRPSVLPQILDRAGSLPCTFASHGEAIRRKHIYVAPPDQHLLIEQGYMRVIRGPKENRHRPSADVLFRTAAFAYGSRVVGIVLTGALDDGAKGLQSVKRHQGITIVQAPEDALVASMPQHALESVEVDYSLPLVEIAPLLVRLTDAAAHESAEDGVENRVESNEGESAESISGFTCPDCHGALWELRDGELVRFRCRVGHTFSPDSLLEGQSEALEEALWSAIRGLEEQAALTRRLERRMRERGLLNSARRFDERTRELEQKAELLRQFVLNNHFDTQLRDDPQPT